MWLVEVERKYSDIDSDIPYGITVIADDHKLKIDTGITERFIVAGEKIRLDAKVFENGKLITSLYSANVNVKK